MAIISQNSEDLHMIEFTVHLNLNSKQYLWLEALTISKQNIRIDMEVIIDLSTRIFISPWGEIYLEHFLKYLGKFYLASLNMQEKLKSQASHISVWSPLTWRRRNKNITSICTSSFSYVFVFLECVSIFDW